MERITNGVFEIEGKIATKNLYPGSTVYGEKTREVDGTEYRFWNPYRSKPAAAFKKGLKEFPVKEGKSILYLGVGEGTTASHLSDILREEGIIIGVDIAEKSIEKFMMLCEERKNLIPVLADANKPGKYEEYVKEKVDVVYQDLAQRGQTDILVKNIERYLKKDGFFVYMVKARSIDVTKDPKKVFDEEISSLKEAGLEIEKVKYLHPFEKDHAMIIGRN